MYNRRRYRTIFYSVCTSLVVSGMICNPMIMNVVRAQENVTTTSAVLQDTSDLLTSSIIFKKGETVYAQPFVNFLPAGQTVTTGLEGFHVITANPEMLDQYIDLINEILSEELHQESRIEMITDEVGTYYNRVYAYQFGEEARKYLQEQLAYHAIGGLSGDVVIDLDQVPLSTVDITNEEKASTVSLLGTYETDYRTSSSSRCNNVELAASNFNGTVVNPGEVISCSTLFQRRTAENGYKMAGVFSNGEVIQGMGGGVCQVSSTVYAASLKAGLEIVERHPHSMPVSYIPVGMDATISYPALDLRIKNNQQVPVLFKATTQNKKVKIQIFSIN